MAELPKCRICGLSAEPVAWDVRLFRHENYGNTCPLAGGPAFTEEQWTKLMGQGEAVEIGTLILPGIDSGEYPDCDIEWHSEIAEKLQEQLVTDEKTVTIPIYIGHPAPAVDDGAVRDAINKMTDAQRLKLFSNYCLHCGCDDPRCQCWNDE